MHQILLLRTIYMSSKCSKIHRKVEKDEITRGGYAIDLLMSTEILILFLYNCSWPAYSLTAWQSRPLARRDFWTGTGPEDQKKINFGPGPDQGTKFFRRFGPGPDRGPRSRDQSSGPRIRTGPSSRKFPKISEKFVSSKFESWKKSFWLKIDQN